MAAVPRSYIDGYADGLEDISREMKRALADALAAVDWDRPVAEVREELCAIMRTYCGASADLASSLAAEFYSGLRLRMTGDAGTPLATGGGYSDKAVEGAVRAVVQPLADGRDDAVGVITQALLERLGYEVKSAAGKTIFENGRRDSERVRYARVPRGSKSYPNGCPFCQMLASRGFAYRSELKAGGLDPDHYHDSCQCMVVPGFGDNPKVEGYDPRDYDEGYEEWREQDHSEHEANAADRQQELPSRQVRPKNRAEIVLGNFKDALTDTRLYAVASGGHEWAARVAQAESDLLEWVERGYPSARDHNGKQAILVLSSHGNVCVGATALSHIDLDHPGEDGRPAVTIRGIIDSIEGSLGTTEPEYDDLGRLSYHSVGMVNTSAINPDSLELVTAWPTKDSDYKDVGFTARRGRKRKR